MKYVQHLMIDSSSPSLELVMHHQTACDVPGMEIIGSAHCMTSVAAVGLVWVVTQWYHEMLQFEQSLGDPQRLEILIPCSNQPQVPHPIRCFRIPQIPCYPVVMISC